jgi:vitamin B12 transporter
LSRFNTIPKNRQVNWLSFLLTKQSVQIVLALMAISSFSGGFALAQLVSSQAVSFTPLNSFTQVTLLQPIDMNTLIADTEALPTEQDSVWQKKSPEETPLKEESEVEEQGNNGQKTTTGLVIQATKLHMPIQQIGGSVSIVTKQQIQQMQAQSVTEVLQSLPGVTVVQNGGLGSTSSVFIRGTDSDHTLILLDGVRINDPVSPARTFNFLDQISVESIEQVEVLKGPQSTLYGSDAIGGVINIVTPSGEGHPALTARIRSGSFGTLQEDVSASGKIGDVKSFFQMTRQDVRNFSAAGTRYGNRERDGFHNISLIGKLQYQPLENLDLDVLSQYSSAKFDLDRDGGFNNDDPNFDSRNRFFLLSGGGKLRLFNNRMEQTVRLSVTDHKRKTWNNPDAADLSANFERSQYNGQLFNLDVYNDIHLLRNRFVSDTLTVGLNLQHEKADSDARFDSVFGPFRSTFQNRSATNLAFYAQDVIRVCDRLYTTLGFRTDDHNRFGRYTTYKAGTTYLVPKTGTALKASYGTVLKRLPCLSYIVVLAETPT